MSQIQIWDLKPSSLDGLHREKVSGAGEKRLGFHDRPDSPLITKAYDLLKRYQHITINYYCSIT